MGSFEMLHEKKAQKVVAETGEEQRTGTAGQGRDSAHPDARGCIHVASDAHDER